jgi:hypothetical protein
MDELWRTSTGPSVKQRKPGNYMTSAQTNGVGVQGEKHRVEERGLLVRVRLMAEQVRALGPRLVRAAPSTSLGFLAFEFGRFELSQ